MGVADEPSRSAAIASATTAVMFQMALPTTTPSVKPARSQATWWPVAINNSDIRTKAIYTFLDRRNASYFVAD